MQAALYAQAADFNKTARFYYMKAQDAYYLANAQVCSLLLQLFPERKIADELHIQLLQASYDDWRRARRQWVIMIVLDMLSSYGSLFMMTLRFKGSCRCELYGCIRPSYCKNLGNSLIICRYILASKLESSLRYVLGCTHNLDSYHRQPSPSVTVFLLLMAVSAGLLLSQEVN